MNVGGAHAHRDSGAVRNSLAAVSNHRSVQLLPGQSAAAEGFLVLAGL